MSKKVIKVIYKCFLCSNTVRDKDAFEVKYISDVQFSPISLPVSQEAKVTLCRTCMANAGYLTQKSKKPKDDKRQTKLFTKIEAGSSATITPTERIISI